MLRSTMCCCKYVLARTVYAFPNPNASTCTHQERTPFRMAFVSLPNSGKLADLASEAGLLDASMVLGCLAPSAAWSMLDSERAIYPASMIKVPLAATCLLEAAAGRFSTDDRVEISPANMTVNDAGSPLVPGYRATVEELVRLAIERSDNVATNELLDLVGRARATELAVERLRLSNPRF